MNDTATFERDLREGTTERLRVMSWLADEPDVLDRLIGSWIAADKEAFHAAIDEIPNPDGRYPHEKFLLWTCDFIGETAGTVIPTQRCDWAKTGSRLSEEELAVLKNTTMPNGDTLLAILVDQGAVTCYTWFDILSGGPAEICTRLS